ncbi:hypothetical protein EIP91_007052 [Steccherinum ochraceum]|uniref:Uncharacterized protein n=1 Tax=Steccherinum ochraceum TaxID=92696 RepID=A0A4R0R7E5_9APHY|nr:hypothetical protein EIP91_007052 [Steccherinum ochraceum]
MRHVSSRRPGSSFANLPSGPQVKVWTEARRRVCWRRSPKVPVAVPVNQNENENEGRRAHTRQKRGSATPPENYPMSVEWEDRVAREPAQWEASPSLDGSLRQRKTYNVMVEIYLPQSNVFIPYDYGGAHAGCVRVNSPDSVDKFATPSLRIAAFHLP